ncbi:MAG: AAA family ATPase [Acaryochloridaceae cyanobacterium RU_4_10]|nr:AAA family ATPase [Acaryochloridaceae cyanobacterium RU_4_10]
MTTIPADKATTLAEASQACDVQELEGEYLDRYYVSLAGRKDAIAEVNTTLANQAPEKFPKLLFAGHVGCGKSSELAKIAKRWQNDFQIVFIKTHEHLRVEDLEYTDLYLLLIQHIEEELRREGLVFDPIVQSDFANWFKDIVQETETTLAGDISLKGEASGGPQVPFLAKLVLKATSQIKGGAKQTTKIRDELKRNIKRLKTDINLLLRDGLEQIKTKFPNRRGFLVIFDGLDRCPEDISKRLFASDAPQLLELNCTIVYTVPIGSLYTLHQINRAFETPYIIPMVNIYKYQGDRPDRTFDPENDFRPEGLQSMASLVKQRVDINAVFESPEEQLETLCKASGGHPRFLMQMVRTAFRIAEGREHLKVQDEDVTYAIKQSQFRFEREINASYYPVLARIALAKQKVDDIISPELLYSTAVLEYNGDNRWIYPNPLVRRSTLFQEALEDARNDEQP